LKAGLAAGENVLLFTFYEQAEEVIEKAARLGMDLTKAWKKGQLQIIWQSSVEASVDQIGSHLVTAFSQQRPARILIDSMQGFQVTADPEERIQDFFAAISDYFVAQGATMMFTAETEDLMGDASLRAPFPNASRMCQNIIVLRHSELSGKVRKVISIFKMRDSDFDSSVREVIIGNGGIRVGEPILDADRVLGGQPVRVPAPANGRRGQ
jgi:circadian clock protein KaiC